MITALYTRKKSVYKKLGIDCWDKERDARNWPGGNSVIAHPPCRMWGRYRTIAKGGEDEKELGRHAVKMVRRWGGVLEHPENSQLWEDMGLPLPSTTDPFGGWTLSIDQSWFGHRAKKRTFLYIVGIQPKELPDYPLVLGKVHTTTIEKMGVAEREATPILLAYWLIKIALQCNQTLQIGQQ